MLERIKEFFRKLFKINNQQYIEAPKEVEEPISNMQEKRSFDFKNQIVVANEEEERSRLDSSGFTVRRASS